MKKKTYSKKFNPLHYKGYLAVLIVLFIALFVLVKIAFGMIKETWQTVPENETVHSSVDDSAKEETFIESEIQIETEKPMPIPVEETDLENEKTLEIRVDTKDPLLILINKENPVPEDIEYTLIAISEEHSVDERMYEDLRGMLDAAKMQGYDLEICSSWRSREVQEKLYANKVDEYLSYGYSVKESEDLAAFWVALPGTSEHEIGLAVDIVSKYHQQLDHSQADTEEQKWLMAHCHEYGFILRYPEDKQDITHIGFEPWHYRYVGKEAAAEIAEQGVCLEEYLQLPAILIKY